MLKTKPRCCPDQYCELYFATFHDEEDPGDSFDCYGKIEPQTFSLYGNVHTNDISHCTYTPLKGMIRYFENKDDQDLMIGRMFRLLAMLGVEAFNMKWYFSKANNLPEVDSMEVKGEVVHLIRKDA